MRDFHIPLLPAGLYHVPNRANGNEHLFRSEENYYYFLKKYKQHITPIAQTLAWCLLPNHYHFLVRIKPVAELKEIHWQKKKCRIEEHCLPEFIMQQFSSWQNSYAKAFNKVYSRKGSLFMDYMRRVEINKDLQLGTSTFYIHKNPIHHGYANKIGDWPFSSYREYLTKRLFIIDSNEVTVVWNARKLCPVSSATS